MQAVLVVLMSPWFQHKGSLKKAQNIWPFEDLEVALVTRTSALPWARGHSLVNFSVTMKVPFEKLKGRRLILADSFRGSSLCAPHALGLHTRVVGVCDEKEP